MKRLPRADQGQTGLDDYPQEAQVGRLAESRLKQKEGYDLHVPLHSPNVAYDPEEILFDK